jgi:hypothetical protein
MKQQNPSKAVQHWADKQIVLFGNHCRLNDSNNQKNLVQLDIRFIADAFEKRYQFLPVGRIA